jgi:hypothetical protein
VDRYTSKQAAKAADRGRNMIKLRTPAKRASSRSGYATDEGNVKENVVVSGGVLRWAVGLGSEVVRW